MTSLFHDVVKISRRRQLHDVVTVEVLKTSSSLRKCTGHEFLIKPLGALNTLNDGILLGHKPFWKEVTIDRLLCLYKVPVRYRANAAKVKGQRSKV